MPESKPKPKSKKRMLPHMIAAEEADDYGRRQGSDDEGEDGGEDGGGSQAGVDEPAKPQQVVRVQSRVSEHELKMVYNNGLMVPLRLPALAEIKDAFESYLAFEARAEEVLPRPGDAVLSRPNRVTLQEIRDLSFQASWGARPLFSRDCDMALTRPHTHIQLYRGCRPAARSSCRRRWP